MEKASSSNKLELLAAYGLELPELAKIFISDDGKLVTWVVNGQQIALWDQKKVVMPERLRHPESISDIYISPYNNYIITIDNKMTLRIFDPNSFQILREFKKISHSWYCKIATTCGTRLLVRVEGKPALGFFESIFSTSPPQRMMRFYDLKTLSDEGYILQNTLEMTIGKSHNPTHVPVFFWSKLRNFSGYSLLNVYTKTLIDKQFQFSDYQGEWTIDASLMWLSEDGNTLVKQNNMIIDFSKSKVYHFDGKGHYSSFGLVGLFDVSPSPYLDPAGKRLYYFENSAENLKVYDVPEGKIISQEKTTYLQDYFDYCPTGIQGGKLSGKFLYLFSLNSIMKIDFETNKLIPEESFLRTEIPLPESIHFLDNDNVIISTQTLHCFVFDLKTRKIKKSFPNKNRIIDVSPDRKYFMSQSNEGQIEIWNLDGYSNVPFALTSDANDQPTSDSFCSFGFSPDSKAAAYRPSSGRELWIDELGAGSITYRTFPYSLGAFLTKDKIVVVNYGKNELSVEELDGKELWKTKVQTPIYSAINIGDNKVLLKWEKFCRIFDGVNNTLSEEISFPGCEQYYSLNVQVIGSSLLMLRKTGITIIDLENKKYVETLKLKSGQHSSFSISPDGSLLAVCCPGIYLYKINK